MTCASPCPNRPLACRAFARVASRHRRRFNGCKGGRAIVPAVRAARIQSYVSMQSGHGGAVRSGSAG
eukprot:2384301-Rhodomonas_salina.1